MKVKGTGSRCLLEECVKDNDYARFHLHTFHCCREMNFTSRLDVNFLDSTQNIDKVGGVWNEGQGYQVKVPACRVCQGQLLCKVSYCCREMNFISRLDVNFLDSSQNIDKVSGAWNEGQGHQVKVPAWRVCQGQLLCKVSSSQPTLLQRNELYF